jgi:hypothetical protein
MATAIVAHWMTAVSDPGVYLEPVHQAMVAIVVVTAVVIGRNRRTHGGTDTGSNDRALATTNFSAERATQGAANATTNRGIERQVVARPRREAECQRCSKEQAKEQAKERAMELHHRTSVTRVNVRVSQMSARKTGNQSHGGRDVIQRKRAPGGRRF